MKVTCWFLSGLISVSSVLPTLAQECCQPVDCCQPTVTQRIMYKTVWDRVPVEAQRVVCEQQLVDQQFTVQRPVYETETRTRRVTVAKPVYETTEEHYTTYRPVVETEAREAFRLQTNWVTETQTREERHMVARPVVETQCRTQQHVVRRPYEETVMQNQNYLVNEPVTTYSTSYVDQGGFVDQVTQTPPTTSYRLGWVPAGFETTPVTAWRHAGFGRYPVTTPGATVVNRMYVPNVVPVQVPQTSVVQKVVTQQVPVTVQKYVDEVVTEQIPVQVQRIEYDEEVRQVPVTVQKQVTERIPYTYNVQTTRYEAVDMVRPVTRQKIQYEEVEQPYEVKVQKVVSEIRTVKKPVMVQKVVPYTYFRLVPRQMQMLVTVDSFGRVISSEPVVGDAAVAGPIVTPRAAGRVTGEPTPADTGIKEKPGTKSAIKKDPKTDAKKKEPADEKPDLNRPTNGDKEKEDDTSAESDAPSV